MPKKFLLNAAAVSIGLAASVSVAAPLKIAMIENFTGPMAQTGIPFVEGVRYGIEKANEDAGTKGPILELIELDSNGGPTVVSDRLKSAIAQGARVVSSAASSVVAAQLSEEIRKFNIRNPGKEVIYYNVGSEAAELTGEKCHYWSFRLGTNPYIRMGALVKVMKEEGVLSDKIFSINQNYSYGHDMQKAQAQAVEKWGGEIVGSVLHDTNKIQDFSPYVARIKASGAETILTGNWANDVILLLRAVGAAGLDARIGNTSLDTTGTLSNAGPAALGAYLVKPYNIEAGGEQGTAFIEDFKKKIGHYPTSEEPTSAFAISLLNAALQQADYDGKEDFPMLKLVQALETTTWKSPLGEMSIRSEDHQALLPITVSTVSKDAKFHVDGTDMGFKLIKVVSAEDAAAPPSQQCKMQRPS
ncbi:ABC transporter substrate-binding protein [Pollutimonas thiosulfatoxidans]|uniref:Branched-chain amino acid ABC transporter substrate-binding protein n=1 Tax=Pollutimonas thiosulfatoxidans TaxID=2028345 RepID=A0A410GG23_9BURK|nr:ABC transporter substrate-binding protein [Pollutimonas thiosulfatoxidans]QAA95241.1 branched-chain amino acid ABC transporter substrate-binding protein [Pollutimonas thiosulfatoxidans]